MSMPGRLLSQPARPTKPSKRSACITVSTESAMTSRDTSEARMPSWPIEMPSDTAMVVNSIGKPPAARTPSLARLASRASGMLHGVTSFQRRGHADLGLVPVVVGHADGPQHGPGRRLLHAVGDVVRARLQSSAMGGTLPRACSADSGPRGPYCRRWWRSSALLVGAAWAALDLGRRPRARAGQRRRLVVGMDRRPHRRRAAGRPGPPARRARAVAPGPPPAGADGGGLRGSTTAWTDRRPAYWPVGWTLLAVLGVSAPRSGLARRSSR